MFYFIFVSLFQLQQQKYLKLSGRNRERESGGECEGERIPNGAEIICLELYLNFLTAQRDKMLLEGHGNPIIFTDDTRLPVPWPQTRRLEVSVYLSVCLVCVSCILYLAACILYLLAAAAGNCICKAHKAACSPGISEVMACLLWPYVMQWLKGKRLKACIW